MILGDKREIIDQQFRYDEIRSNGWLGVSLDTTAVNDGLLLVSVVLR